MKLIFGVIALLFGSAILLWVGYNIFIEMQPEARGRNPVPAIGVGSAMIYVGINWIRGKQAGCPKLPNQGRQPTRAARLVSRGIAP